MKKIFTIGFLLIVSMLTAQNRERTVSGKLTGKDGSAIPGANITIKGTPIGTTTDVNGFYSLRAPIGSTLVISFVGMKTREIVVTKDLPLSAKVKGKQASYIKGGKKPSTLFYVNSDSTKKGVTVMDDKTPVYISNNQVVDPQKILSIKSTNRNKASKRIPPRVPAYHIRYSVAPNYNRFVMQFMSTLSMERITRTPSLQSTNSQGSPQNGVPQWRGPEAAEIFSWGPTISSLEYSGNNYPYDKNGLLAVTGSGNGKPANRYNASRFFRTGISSEHDLLLSIPSIRQSMLLVEVGTKHRGSIVQGSSSTRNIFSVQIKKLVLADNLVTDFATNYNYSEGALTNRGSNLSSIVGAVWRTPISFDNNNGLSSSLAAKSAEASRLTDNSVRSHAPGIVDNPYGLTRELPDSEKQKRFLATNSIRYHESQSNFSFTIENSFDKQLNNVIFGIPPGLSALPSGRLTQRNEAQTYFNSIVSPAYRFYALDGELKAMVSYQFNYNEQALHRRDGIGFTDDTWPSQHGAETTLLTEYHRARATHELLYNLSFGSDLFNVRVANRSYFSNTTSQSSYINFFPTVAAKIRLEQLIHAPPISEMELSGSYSKTIREAALIYSNWSYLSTGLMPEQYNQFYESSELFFHNTLAPETENKFETTFKISLFNQLRLDVNYYSNTTSDFISPVWSGVGYNLSNSARVMNDGTNVYAAFDSYRRNIQWGLGLRFARNNTRVLKLYGDQPYIPFAGFSTTAKVLAAGMPLGAIYGTAYQRTPGGNVMIGEDGFPLVDNNLKMIGNPIPDFVASFDAHAVWKNLRLSCLFDFKHGGDVWNGTHAALDYLGRSENSATGRVNSSYLFEGDLANGQPNVKTVAFYDPAKPLTENRWVRYGFQGVSEEYIEDASWIRLSEVMLSYSIHLNSQSKREIKVSAIAANVFLITPYSGVDPATALFGYAGSNGLDLFNVPATRSFTIRVTFKI